MQGRIHTPPRERRGSRCAGAYAGFGLAGAAALAAVAGVAAPSAPPSSPSFLKDVSPLLAATCLPCHTGESAAAGLDLTRLSDAASVARERKAWRGIAERVERGEMPPPGSPQPSAARRKAFVAAVRASLARAEKADAAGVRDPGPPLLRRLTRAEYDRTIRDLFGGIAFDSAEAVGMPPDAAGEGFDTLAALNVPPALLEKYAAAADRILEQVTGDERGQVRAARDRGRYQRAHDLVFGKARGPKNPAPAPREVIARFARRAWRRPPTAAEVDALAALHGRAAAKGLSGDAAVAPALKAVLISPYFLFRAEAAVPPGAKPGQVVAVDDLALASRLSYFLWSSMPDEELLALAERGQLSDPATRKGQVARMLADPKADALTERFAVQWLHIDKLAEARPSREFFPTFTASLREAMYRETTAFFDHLRAEDRPVLDLLNADYTFVNRELARHYGVPYPSDSAAAAAPGGGPRQAEMVRVALGPGSHRGGLLGMGSVLALTSHTYRTSPTLRGKWVLDVIFGTPPPPPPPGVSQIEGEQSEKGGEAKTFRELLAQHARQPACAGCHQKMDPLGYALENYDAIGKWRTAGGGGQPLDTSAVLPNGKKLDGADALRREVWERRDAFVKNLAERMLSYALGRELVGADEAAVRDVVARMAKEEYRFSALIGGVVESYPFRHRRLAAAAAAATPPPAAPAVKPAAKTAPKKPGARGAN